MNCVIDDDCNTALIYSRSIDNVCLECLPASKKVTEFAAPFMPHVSFKESIEQTAALLQLQDDKESLKAKEPPPPPRYALTLPTAADMLTGGLHGVSRTSNLFDTLSALK
jgi:hypothetical protein